MRASPARLIAVAFCTALGLAFQSASGAVVTPIHTFKKPPSEPTTELILAADGAFYGTTPRGGKHNAGTIFKMSADGEVTQLVSFPPDLPSESRRYVSPLVQASNGNFYGVSKVGGGKKQLGKVFELNAEGDLRTLVKFTGANGLAPGGQLVEGSDGALYGITKKGGESGMGTVFKVTPSGEFTSLVSFDEATVGFPTGGLMLASNGNFYGTTAGTVFEVTPAGVLNTFALLPDTEGSYSTLTEGSDGSFYGTGVIHNDPEFAPRGIVFKVTPAGDASVLHRFAETDGRFIGRQQYQFHPHRLVEGDDGSFYGTTAGRGDGGVNLGTVFSITPDGVFMTVASLTYHLGGRAPCAGLAKGPDGFLYGSTRFGGWRDAGTIFKVSPSGQMTTLSTFPAPGGAKPLAGLVETTNGLLYGTTAKGGKHDYGTIFRITPTGKFTTILSFDGANGNYPAAELIQGRDGLLYGTTERGGAHRQYSSGAGTVFKVTEQGVLTTLVSFGGTASGAYPRAPLVQSRINHLFYGTTSHGGASNEGSVYRVSSTGDFGTVFSFIDGDAPKAPVAGLIEGVDGNLYGTTTGYWHGAVFRIMPQGLRTRLIVLHRFQGGDGSGPRAELTAGPDGAFYGVTSSFGQYGKGTVYKIFPNGVFTSLASFSSRYSGLPPPIPRLVFGKDGRFYGVTTRGGSFGAGTIFSMDPAGTLSLVVQFDFRPGQVRGPSSPLIQARNGLFYGTSSGDGLPSTEGSSSDFDQSLGQIYVLDPYAQPAP